MWSFLFRLYLKISGWEYELNLPAELKKFVVVAAPHTSNFDFPVSQAVFYLMGMKVKFLAKSSLFKGVFGKLFHRWGGIPVDRGDKFNLVDQLKERFDQADELALIISPEGTRKAVKEWKTGFYYIAKGAGVPIVCGYMDYARKKVGIGPVITELDDLEKVKFQIREFYRGITPKYPESYVVDFI